MQVDPVKPTVKAPGTKRLKLNSNILRSILPNFTFNFNLRRYIWGTNVTTVVLRFTVGNEAMQAFVRSSKRRTPWSGAAADEQSAPPGFGAAAGAGATAGAGAGTGGAAVGAGGGMGRQWVVGDATWVTYRCAL